MGKKVDLIGQRFGKLTVIDIYDIKDERRNHKWLCKCDCGNTHSVSTTNLLGGVVKSCGCYLKEFKKRDGNLTAQRVLFTAYKRNAKHKNIEFLLTEEEFHKLVNKSCFYCGIEPSTITRPNYRNEFNMDECYIHNGIDRIDSDKGYITDNCVPCCPTCNYAKREMSTTQFFTWIDRVYKNLSKNSPNIENKDFDVTTKGVGILADDLCTTSQKLWHLQEIYMNKDSTDSDIADAFRKIQSLNVRRNYLINAIDKLANPNIASTTEKTYH
jgi:hypothetical protein